MPNIKARKQSTKKFRELCPKPLICAAYVCWPWIHTVGWTAEWTASVHSGISRLLHCSSVNSNHSNMVFVMLSLLLIASIDQSG